MGVIFKAFPIGFWKDAMQKRRHAIGYGLAGIRLHKNTEAKVLDEVAHGAGSTGSENISAGFHCRGQSRALRVESRGIGRNYEISGLEIALAFFILDEVIADENSLRQPQILGEQFVVFERAVAMVGNPADDDEGGLGIFKQSANDEVEILVVADVTEGQKDFFSTGDFPLLADFFWILANLLGLLGSNGNLNRANEFRDRVGVWKPLVGDRNSEWLVCQVASKFLPPFRSQVVVTIGEVEVHSVDGLAQENQENVWPHPQGALAIHMAGRQHKRRIVFINLPSENQLIAHGLECLSDFAREGICAVRRGPLDHAGDRGVFDASGAFVGWATEDKHFNPKSLQCCGLLVHMVRNHSVRTGTLDQDIDRIFVVGLGHGKIWKLQAG